MTGPEHYREAEKLLRSCQIDRATDREAATYPAVEDGVNSIGNALAAAQVHATLALAAALLYPTPGQVAAASMAVNNVNNVNRGGGFGIQAGVIHGGVTR